MEFGMEIEILFFIGIVVGLVILYAKSGEDDENVLLSKTCPETGKRCPVVIKVNDIGMISVESDKLVQCCRVQETFKKVKEK
jgi:uncharacterized membrane protein YagU involved in acid resistance